MYVKGYVRDNYKGIITSISRLVKELLNMYGFLNVVGSLYE